MLKEKIKDGTEKLQWLARRLQENSILKRRRFGFHFPDKHLSPFEVAPPRRDDGKTFCDSCDLTMKEWKELEESEKKKFIDQAWEIDSLSKEWDEAH